MDLPSRSELGIAQHEDLRAAWPQLAGVDSRFLASLSWLDPGMSLRCDETLTSLVGSDGQDGTVRLSVLALVWATLMPSTDYLEDLAWRVGGGGLHEPEDLSDSSAETLLQFQRFGTEDRFQCLGTRTRGKPTQVIRATLSNAPGITWSSLLELWEVSPHWSAVVAIGDYEDDPSLAYPQVIGYLKAGASVRSLAWLLSHQEATLFWGFPEEVSAPGWSRLETEMVRVGWTRRDEYAPELSDGAWLRHFSDQELEALIAEYGGLGKDGLLDDLEHAIEASEAKDVMSFHAKFFPLAEGDSLTRLRSREAARPDDLADFVAAARDAQIQHGCPLDPFSLPAEMRVCDLEEVHRRLLAKWLSEVRHFPRASVGFAALHRTGLGLKMGPRRFQIALDDALHFFGPAIHYGRSRPPREEFPTVHEAFRDVLGGK